MKKKFKSKVLVFKNCFDCMAGSRNYCAIDSELYLFDKNLLPYTCPLRKRDYILTLDTKTADITEKNSH